MLGRLPYEELGRSLWVAVLVRHYIVHAQGNVIDSDWDANELYCCRSCCYFLTRSILFPKRKRKTLLVAEICFSWRLETDPVVAYDVVDCSNAAQTVVKVGMCEGPGGRFCCFFCACIKACRRSWMIPTIFTSGLGDR